MRAFLTIVSLELKSLWRSGTVALLTVASLAWMLCFPHLSVGDGTSDGAREMDLLYSLGGVAALLVLSLLSCAAGSIAKERVARRLQLTQIRPVRLFAIVLGKFVALLSVGAAILALAACCLAWRMNLASPCSHVLSPLMPSPKEEARAMYEAYRNDPKTPDEIKKARKSVVMRLLEQRAIDHYQTIATNASAVWRFDLAGQSLPEKGVSIRMRFTNQYEMRQDLFGDFTLGTLTGVVSNMTQAVLTIPLKAPAGADVVSTNVLVFANAGRHTLMLRPRKDINLLLPADTFAANLVRAVLQLVSILAIVIAFGLFLSASLSRPVALFVAIVLLLVSEMSPSVVEQYPDSLEADTIDHMGLVIARTAAQVTHPISALSPLEALSKDECIECGSVVRSLLLNVFLLPFLLSLLSAIILPRKQEV